MGNEKTVLMLSNEKLRILANLVHKQEENRIKSAAFKSEKDRSQYLRDSREVYLSELAILDQADQLRNDVGGHNGPPHLVVHLAQTYIEHCVEHGLNIALRTVWNLHLRREYLKKIKTHTDTHMADIKDINSKIVDAKAKATRASELKVEAEAEKAAQLEKAAQYKAEVEAAPSEEVVNVKKTSQVEAEAAAEKAAATEIEAQAEVKALEKTLAQIEDDGKKLVNKLVTYKDTQCEFMRKWKHPSSRHFSSTLHRKGVTFKKMVKKHQLKLVREKGPKYGGKFEELDDAKKIEIYDEVVESSGRGSMLRNSARALDAAGKAVFVISLGMMVWDIYTSHNRFQTAVKDGAEITASVVGSMAGEAIGTAVGTAVVATAVGAEVTTAVAATVGVGAAVVSSAFVCLAAAVTGIGLGIALGALAGWAVVKIFESGGEHASKIVNVQQPRHPTPPPPRPQPPPMKKSDTGIRVYVAPMPDGDLIARQIAYYDSRVLL